MSGSHRRSDLFSGSPDGTEHGTSVDGRRSDDYSSPVKQLNGLSVANGVDSNEDSHDPVQRLQLELERTREEKDALAAQYRNLLAKLTQMRTSLGNKLQQDAVRNCFHHAWWKMLSNHIGRKSLTDENNLCSSSQRRELTLMLQ